MCYSICVISETADCLTKQLQVSQQLNSNIWQDNLDNGKALSTASVDFIKSRYVLHTNNKGLYSEQTTANIANNTVDLGKSVITPPLE